MNYLIWSNEHKAWWRPVECGYTQSKEEADLYSLKRATEICLSANRHLGDDRIPHEAIVPIDE